MKRLLALLLVMAMVAAYVPLITVQVEAVANTTEFAGGSGTEEDPYLISTPEHLYSVRNYLSAHFKMVNDIDLTAATAEGGDWDYGGRGWNPIGSDNVYGDSAFSGIFDGNGYTIEGLRIYLDTNNVPSGTGYSTYVGLFANVTGTVRNLHLTNVNVTNHCSYNTNYHPHCSAIVAKVSETGTVENCSVSGGVTSYCYCGGLVGYNSGNIKNCYNEATVTSYSYSYAGGIAGLSTGSTAVVSNCYNKGNIYGGCAGGIVGYNGNYAKIVSSYNVGTVKYSATSTSLEYGIADIYGGTITNSYYLDGTGESSTGATALTSTQMQLQSVYAGFDFENVWTMDGDADYPYPELQCFVYWGKKGTCGENMTWILDDEGTLTISGTGAMTNSVFGESPWYGNTAIKNVIIEEGVTSIGDDAFDGCTELTSVAIPDSVTAIGDLAFFECDSLTNVTYCGTSEQWGEISVGLNPSLSDELLSYHKWDVVTKEPTFIAMGQKTSTCAHCGEQKTEAIPAKFYGTSVELGNTLDMYFAFYNRLVDENGKVKFVRKFADGTTETTEAPITSFNKNNSLYDITYTGLAAKEMCDTIHVYVYNGEGTLVGQHSDSIRSYILRQLREKEYGQEFRTLCIDLLNYGAAAQETFGYNTGDLANKDLTAEELAEGTQNVAEYTNKQTVTGTTAAYYGTAYLLETKISMSMAVRASYFDDGCYALVSYTDHTGTEKNNIRLEGKKNNSVYEFFLNEIVVADGRCLLTIEFYKADGTKVVTVKDSMESYTARNAEKYPLAEKMLAFSDSAYKYLHRNDK